MTADWNGGKQQANGYRSNSMKTSESVKSLAAALVKAQSEFPAIPRNKTVQVKTKSGGTYTFAYAPLDTIMERVRPTLKTNGLAFIQSLNGESLTTTLLHQSGEWMESDPLPIRVTDQGSQALGSAITYARRYALTAMLGLVTDEDDDGNSADGNEVKLVNAPKPQKAVTVAEWDNLTADVQIWLSDMADSVRAELNQKGPKAAVALLDEQGLSPEHKVAIWSRFDSKERSAMKAAKKEAA